MVKVPIAAGEEWGNRWDFNPLVENHDIDYVRATLPNVGGITEMMKIAAICEISEGTVAASIAQARSDLVAALGHEEEVAQ